LSLFETFVLPDFAPPVLPPIRHQDTYGSACAEQVEDSLHIRADAAPYSAVAVDTNVTHLKQSEASS